MAKEEVNAHEEVWSHCKHEDCIYRIGFTRSDECCAYMLATDRPRGCSISQCDKYKSGTRKVRIDWETMALVWIYGDDGYGNYRR